MKGDDSFDLLSDKSQLIFLIDRLLSDLLSETQNLSRVACAFNCKEKPSISIHDYLVRIGKYSHCSPCVFVAALIYIDRYQERIEDLVINFYNVHRLMISCIMIAAKFWDDFYFKNEFYARIGGISKKDMNALELELMEKFEFSLFIGEQEFMSYLSRIESYRDVNLMDQVLSYEGV